MVWGMYLNFKNMFYLDAKPHPGTMAREGFFGTHAQAM